MESFWLDSPCASPLPPDFRDVFDDSALFFLSSDGDSYSLFHLVESEFFCEPSDTATDFTNFACYCRKNINKPVNTLLVPAQLLDAYTSTMLDLDTRAFLAVEALRDHMTSYDPDQGFLAAFPEARAVGGRAVEGFLLDLATEARDLLRERRAAIADFLENYIMQEDDNYLESITQIRHKLAVQDDFPLRRPLGLFGPIVYDDDLYNIQANIDHTLYGSLKIPSVSLLNSGTTVFDTACSSHETFLGFCDHCLLCSCVVVGSLLQPIRYRPPDDPDFCYSFLRPHRISLSNLDGTDERVEFFLLCLASGRVLNFSEPTTSWTHGRRVLPVFSGDVHTKASREAGLTALVEVLTHAHLLYRMKDEPLMAQRLAVLADMRKKETFQEILRVLERY